MSRSRVVTPEWLDALRKFHGPVPSGRAEPHARHRSRPGPDPGPGLLGFHEAWVGEHHSAGYEIIASPEVFIAVAAERTKHIKLGTGVSSLPYHHPLMLADRMVLLDHLTRGRGDARRAAQASSPPTRTCSASPPTSSGRAWSSGSTRSWRCCAARPSRWRPTGSRSRTRACS